MVNSFLDYGGKVFINFDFFLVFGEYVVIIDVCNFDGFKNDDGVLVDFVYVDYIGLIVGGNKDNFGILFIIVIEIFSLKFRVVWGEIK